MSKKRDFITRGQEIWHSKEFQRITMEALVKICPAKKAKEQETPPLPLKCDYEWQSGPVHVPKPNESKEE